MEIVIFDDMELSRSVIFAKNFLVRIRSIDSQLFRSRSAKSSPKKATNMILLQFGVKRLRRENIFEVCLERIRNELRTTVIVASLNGLSFV